MELGAIFGDIASSYLHFITSVSLDSIQWLEQRLSTPRDKLETLGDNKPQYCTVKGCYLLPYSGENFGGKKKSFFKNQKTTINRAVDNSTY